MCSLNVNGLNNRLKRKKIFKELHRYKYDLCLIQETYSTVECEQMWKNEWGEVLFSRMAVVIPEE